MKDFPPYREREARFSVLHACGEWVVKVYTIDAGGPIRSADVVPAALARIPDLLPDVVAGGFGASEGTGEVHGEAFAIVHAGADAVWLLVHWWEDHCLLHGRMVAAPLDRPTAFDQTVPSSLVACTWELAVLHFERDAWVRTVQGKGPQADTSAYHRDVMGATLV